VLDNIRAALADMWDDMVGFAQRLVQTPSITGEEGKLAALICDEMQKLGYDRVFRDSTGNVIGVISGTGGGQHVLYNFHMDHVSPGNLDAWEYPPYDGVIADGYLHGRGASDVKGAMAVQVYAAACMKRVGIPHRGDIIVTGVVDEEPGDMWGMRRMAQEVLANYPGKIGLVVLAEATGLDIYLGHRGRLEIELDTFGKIGHSSSPWRGVNAVYEMRKVISAIEELDSRLPQHDFLGKSTICITNIKCSPGWGSIIPDKCTIFLDRRFLPSEDRNSILKELESISAGGGLYKKAEFRIRPLALYEIPLPNLHLHWL
jgi:putative selenium metabolism hydrolase